MKQRALQSLRRAASTLTKEAGDISSVFPSLSGKAQEPLPPRFSELKKTLIAGNEDAVKASWHRLLSSLRQEIDEIKQKGNSVIPIIDYSQIQSNQVSQSDISAIKHRGLAVIKNVVPRQEALDMKAQAQSYIAANKPNVRAFPADDPAVYELYWTPTQVHARGHPAMLATQTFLTSLWHSSSPSSPISTRNPLTYADRFRIRRPGDAKFALGPHTDGGSVERWEDPSYSRVYNSILHGSWEAYDPFDARHRITAKMDMYNGPGACSMFRLFQGWLSLSSTGPNEGTLKVYPLLRHATAYLMLRPFFSLPTHALDLESTAFPNSALGAGQEYSDATHPHLQLEDAMVHVPHVEPGDYVAWHCDAIHAVDKEHRGTGDSSVLYIPACAMTPGNLEFLKRQREAARRWSPPPDFPGAGGEGERGFRGKVNWEGREGGLGVGEEGRRAMGFGGSEKGWEVREGMSVGEKGVVEMGNRLLFE